MMPPQKGSHQIICDDRVWGGLRFKADTKHTRISDYLEPILVEILRLEKEGLDPLVILKRAKKKEGS